MKTNAKKRMLVSSVAMLLVAMIALGTATFAWFTQNTETKADKISASTSKVSSLVLSNYTRTNWKSHLEYNFSNDGMYPASSADGETWYGGNASDGVTGALSANTLADVTPENLASTRHAATDYLFADELNIKNSGAVDVENVEITFNVLSSASDYVRVAVVPIQAGVTTAGTFNNDTIYAKAKEEGKNPTYDPISGFTTAESGAKTPTYGVAITPKNTFTVSVPDLAKGKAAYYKVLVWFEGQDVDCIDANSGQSLNLTFNVSGDPVEPVTP